MTPEQRLENVLSEELSRRPFDALWVAVSGGGDSMALLHLAAAWAKREAVALHAVTVDHGLRAEAAAEARFVKETCTALDVPHVTLTWAQWDGQGNVQAEARAARYALIAQHIASHGPAGPVLVAHTKDDLAETFLMRLARGSGVDGLAAMKPAWEDHGLHWLRPVLEVSRQELRDWLSQRDFRWIEDPSNDDDRFDRVRVRQAMADLGIDTARLVTTAHNMASAREVLRLAAFDAAQKITCIDRGDVVFDAEAFAKLPSETRFRLLAHALRWVSSATYRPRQAALEQSLQEVAKAGKSTLSGCILAQKHKELRIAREWSAVAQSTAPVEAVWDRRWRVSPTTALKTNGYELRALGETGLRACPDWRATGHRRTSLLASPAIWSKDSLVAAPLAMLECPWSAVIDAPMGDFFTSLLSH